MIHVLLADGVIDDSEVKMAISIYQKIANKKLEAREFKEEIRQIKTKGEDLSSLLISLQGVLNAEGKEMVVAAALQVALADGEFHDDEKLLIDKIGSDLGMTPAHIKGVIASGQ